ncbi:MnhB domain-containing protein [Phycisphaera mikurensis]|uniref:Na(+)/H(+) antiporter subunit B n=1 Tax=Phycisphaera mikurensis (strain NBRC 102666 / KCTC 22515 / FYK2301M01) TaxID=1142394 RepID=I0IC45_PHYMF|nr:MnhB domain-containing protein [Phycisphaera mikurensis]MBB6441946.1 multisubunit Na+/H+ antiporter MnhB subunit [Phycisphaera mikurensis]BAM02833.1 Na(+)/H(+) antiporter subunit B [Phycisphaera mikurensis NBRC 102666]
MSSLLFQTAARLILPLSLVFAAYMMLKGHNAPGGGFIGGLTAAVALIVYAMACGREALLRLIPVHPRTLIAAGLLLAAVTGALPLLWGNPMLTSTVIDAFPIVWGQSIHFVSVFFFDTGVVLVVIGASTGLIQRLGEQIEDGEEPIAGATGVEPAPATAPPLGREEA